MLILPMGAAPTSFEDRVRKFGSVQVLWEPFVEKVNGKRPNFPVFFVPEIADFKRT